MFHRYRHEADLYPSLSRVPLHVRMKLDLTGTKISLNDWLAFAIEERYVLCHLPTESEEERKVFSDYIDFLSRKHRGSPVPTTLAIASSLWDSPHQIPEPVAAKSIAAATPVTLVEWQRWQSHQRYALYKTALSKSEPDHFPALLRELRETKG
jgi:hypothetical protein